MNRSSFDRNNDKNRLLDVRRPPESVIVFPIVIALSVFFQLYVIKYYLSFISHSKRDFDARSTDRGTFQSAFR